MFYRDNQSGETYIMRGEGVYGGKKEPVYILENKTTGKVLVLDKTFFTVIILHKDGTRQKLYEEIT